MTAEFRRQLALVIVGIVGAIVALLTATYLRQRACLEAGGRWLVETETCELAAGVAPPGSVRSYLLGAVVGLLLAAMLWRVFTALAARSSSR